ncbi:maleylacetoacetate isomerase [Francisellaceae bacterium CB299]|jgi:maleylacetoacetate isomerase
MITLYDYFRSTASYRVRIALNIKGLGYQLKEVHLVNNGGEQFSDEYKKLNPFARVPTLIDGDFVLTQSLAIIEYLDAKYPTNSLIPTNIELAGQIREFCQIIASDIHPINNLSVLKYLQKNLGVSDEDKNKWYHHWIINGFDAIEKILESSAGKFCFGDSVTLADICLVAQVYNANRFNVPVDNYPNIVRINSNCLNLEEFKKASPDNYIS